MLNPKKPPLQSFSATNVLASMDAWLAKKLSFFSNFLDKAQNIVATNFELGCDHAAAGNVKDAIFRFRIVTYLEPKHLMAWYNLGCCRISEGRTDLAVQAFRKALAIKPDHEETRFMLATLPNVPMPKEQLPRVMPPTLLASHFDSLAPTYTAEQLTTEDYRGHTQLYDLLSYALDPQRNDYRMMELGTGTGICGPLLRVRSKRLEGIEISPAMAAIADRLRDDKNQRVYDAIHQEDFRTYLSKPQDPPFEVVFAANTLNFIGELTPVFDGVVRVVAPGGIFAFFTDKAPSPGFEFVRALGRFGHSPEYIQAQASRTGFEVLKLEDRETYPKYSMLYALLRKQ